MRVTFPDELLKLIGRVGKMLTAQNMLLGTAESCTGGLIAALCTELPGSSDWFAGGLVSYSNQLKRNMLGVDEALLLAHGAVSGPVVEAMAGGALRRLEVDLALAVSGVAGPGGGTKDKPVGTVWIAAAKRGAAGAAGGPAAIAGQYFFSGDRGAVRAASVLAALTLAEELLA